MSCARCGAAVLAGGPCPRCLLGGPAETFAGLELLEPLGEGGMGTVFRARHVQLNRLVAVKFLKPAHAADVDLKARFMREGQALAKVSHPNVVQVFDAGEADGEAYLVMEYVDGGTAAARAPLEPREAVRITRSLCDALQAVHAAGLVHRDVKPDNLLLTSSGALRLSDFGIVRETAQAWTRPGAVAGTPGFTAPEVLRGEPATPAADVYGAGATLRALLTGQAPVGEVSLPPSLEPILRRAMAQDPSQRFPSVAELQLALSEVTLEEAGALPPEEQLWLRAVALSMTVAFAAVAWAGVVSLTPRVHAAGELPPLVALGARTLEDGRLATLARFETGWVLAAAALVAVALAAVGALRRHWRRSGLLVSRPTGRLPWARATFASGAAALVLYLARRAWWDEAWLAWVPLVGGLLLLGVAWCASLARLEAWRRGRRLLREPEWVLGVIAGAIPPVVDGLRQMVERFPR